LNTQTVGTPIVVYNPLNIEREDVVEVTMSFSTPTARVIGPDGREVPAQVIREQSKLLFLTQVPSVGYAVYEIRSGAAASSTTLKVSPSSLENDRYRIALNDGDVSSIFDKKLNRELIDAPIRLAIKNDTPAQ